MINKEDKAIGVQLVKINREILNYKIGQLIQNYILNRHRQNALDTFETFVTATADNQNKDAVLLQATQTIFSAQNSGFINQDSESPNLSPLLELIKRPS
jgi:hypothetical protein